MADGSDLDPAASPRQTFGELIARTVDDLASLTFVAEWVGPGKRVPVFDTTSLREFARDADRRIFLADLLASYTHVASGRVWSRTRHGWRKRRYSELDPLWLAELIEALPEPRRSAAIRRLGDLALFLAGVFPDHSARHPLEPRHLARIVRAIEGGGERIGVPPIAAGAFEEGGVTVLEWLGRSCYQKASQSWPSRTGRAELGSYRLAAHASSAADVRSDVAEHIVDARRFLNVLTDRYLFRLRERWFPVA